MSSWQKVGSGVSVRVGDGSSLVRVDPTKMTAAQQREITRGMAIQKSWAEGRYTVYRVPTASLKYPQIYQRQKAEQQIRESEVGYDEMGQPMSVRPATDKLGQPMSVGVDMPVQRGPTPQEIRTLTLGGPTIVTPDTRVVRSTPEPIRTYGQQTIETRPEDVSPESLGFPAARSVTPQDTFASAGYVTMVREREKWEPQPVEWSGKPWGSMPQLRVSETIEYHVGGWLKEGSKYVPQLSEYPFHPGTTTKLTIFGAAAAGGTFYAVPYAGQAAAAYRLGEFGGRAIADPSGTAKGFQEMITSEKQQLRMAGGIAGAVLPGLAYKGWKLGQKQTSMEPVEIISKPSKPDYSVTYGKEAVEFYQGADDVIYGRGTITTKTAPRGYVDPYLQKTITGETVLIKTPRGLKTEFGATQYEFATRQLGDKFYTDIMSTKTVKSSGMWAAPKAEIFKVTGEQIDDTFVSTAMGREFYPNVRMAVTGDPAKITFLQREIITKADKTQSSLEWFSGKSIKKEVAPFKGQTIGSMEAGQKQLLLKLSGRGPTKEVFEFTIGGKLAQKTPDVFRYSPVDDFMFGPTKQLPSNLLGKGGQAAQRTSAQLTQAAESARNLLYGTQKPTAPSVPQPKVIPITGFTKTAPSPPGITMAVKGSAAITTSYSMRERSGYPDTIPMFEQKTKEPPSRFDLGKPDLIFKKDTNLMTGTISDTQSKKRYKTDLTYTNTFWSGRSPKIFQGTRAKQDTKTDITIGSAQPSRTDQKQYLAMPQIFKTAHPSRTKYPTSIAATPAVRGPTTPFYFPEIPKPGKPSRKKKRPKRRLWDYGAWKHPVATPKDMLKAFLGGKK